jgi:hypothetical protein
MTYAHIVRRIRILAPIEAGKYRDEDVKYLSYRQVVSNARKNLEWLLGDMKKD